MAILTDDIKFLPGVGPKRAELLGKELGIFTFEDLICFFPYKYIDRTKFYKISELNSNLPYIQVKGKIVSFNTVGKPNKQRLIAGFEDGSGYMELVWFKGAKWIRQSLSEGIEYIVFGKPNIIKGIVNIAHPEIEKVADYEAKLY